MLSEVLPMYIFKPKKKKNLKAQDIIFLWQVYPPISMSTQFSKILTLETEDYNMEE